MIVLKVAAWIVGVLLVYGALSAVAVAVLEVREEKRLRERALARYNAEHAHEGVVR